MSDENDLTEYTVDIGGIDHTMLLSDEDAERMGVKGKSRAAAGKARSAENKARTPAANKGKA